MSEHRVDLTELAKIRDGTGHTIFSPSSSPMWLACAGSLIPNLLAGDDAGVDAAYGTVAHGVAETWLRTGKAPKHLLGTNEFVESGDWGFLIDIDEEMFDYVKDCVDACEWLMGDHIVEQKVWMPSGVYPIANQGGTMDFAALQPGIAHVRDHKFGVAETIYAEENPQVMLYALMLMLKYDEKYHFKDIIIGINQPRLNHFDEWHTTRQHLLEFKDYVRERAHKAWAYDAPRTPGPKQCRYCAINSTCAARAMLQEELVSSAFEAVREEYTPEAMQAFKDRLDDDLDPYKLEMVDVGNLSTFQLAKLKPFRKSAEAWWSSIDAELERRSSLGEKIPGYKLVNGKSTRRIKNQAKFIRLLEEKGFTESEIWKKELISPAQAEDLLPKHGVRKKDAPVLFADVVEKLAGKPTLVPEIDPRPAIVDTSASAFKDETGTSVNRESEEL